MAGIALLLLGLLGNNIGNVPQATYYPPGGSGGARCPPDNEAPNDGVAYAVWYGIPWLLIRGLETKITEPKNVRNSIKAEKGWREVKK